MTSNLIIKIRYQKHFAMLGLLKVGMTTSLETVRP